MAVATTASRVVITPQYDDLSRTYGPMDSVPYDVVLLTDENLRQVGSTAKKVGQFWECKLVINDLVADVETARDLTDYTLTSIYYDPISRAATQPTVELGVAASGQLIFSSTTAADLVAGMYRLEITGNPGGDVSLAVPLVRGWFEILQAAPVAS